jgi:hypothetical protein
MYKFRAWDIENRIMLSWEEIQEMWESEGYTRSIFNEDRYKCMPYTGINDIHGNEIYLCDFATGKSSKTIKIPRKQYGGYDEDGYWINEKLHIEHKTVINDDYYGPVKRNNDGKYYVEGSIVFLDNIKVEVKGNIYEGYKEDVC